MHHFRVFHRRLQQHFLHFVQIRTVGHADADHQTRGGIGKRPVDQTLRHKCFVRDDHLFAIEVGNGGGTDTDLADRSGERTDGHGIADAYRAFKQNNQTRNKVTEDFLQAKTKTNRQGCCQPL